MDELLKGKRQQWVYGLSIISGISFVLKGQIFGNLILDLLSSRFTAYFFRHRIISFTRGSHLETASYSFSSHSKNWREKVSILSIGNGVSFNCLLFVAQFSLALLFQMRNGQAFTKSDADILVY